MKSTANPASAKLSRSELEKVAAIFAAFADATRLGILQELKAGPRSVGDLVDCLGSSQANISKHLKQLHQAGLLVRERDGLQIFYRAAGEDIYDVCKFACQRLNEHSQSLAVRDTF